MTDNNNEMDLADVMDSFFEFADDWVNAEGSRFTQFDVMTVAFAWIQAQLEIEGFDEFAKKVSALGQEFKALPADRCWRTMTPEEIQAFQLTLDAAAAARPRLRLVHSQP